MGRIVFFNRHFFAVYLYLSARSLPLLLRSVGVEIPRGRIAIVFWSVFDDASVGSVRSIVLVRLAVLNPWGLSRIRLFRRWVVVPAALAIQS